VSADITKGFVGQSMSGETKRRDSDFYPTPHNVTWALLKYFNFTRRLTAYDPCAGEGDMVIPLKEWGFSAVYASDLRDGAEIVGETKIDFLLGGYEPDADILFMNPPFSLASQFIQRAVWKYPRVCALVKAQYWHAVTRLPIFENDRPSHVLPLTWRPDFSWKDEEPQDRPVMDVLWTCWGMGGPGAPTIYQPLPKPVGLPEGLIS